MGFPFKFAIDAGVGGAKKLFRLIGFGKGHDDDAVDDAEEQILFNFLVPVINSIQPGAVAARPFWQDANAAAAALDINNSPLTPDDAQQLIAQGDALLAEACASFAEQGFPCKSGGGAGGDIQPLWDTIRGKLQQIAAKQTSIFPKFFGAGSASQSNTGTMVALAAAAVVAVFLAVKK